MMLQTISPTSLTLIRKLSTPPATSPPLLLDEDVDVNMGAEVEAEEGKEEGTNAAPDEAVEEETPDAQIEE
jgi:hypothetical protein